MSLPTTPIETSTKVAHAATGLMQSFTPIKQIGVHLAGIHSYVVDPSRQLEAHHFCSHLTEDFRQCVIYDSYDRADAKLIGVEYVISKAMYEMLPAEEKQYWHSHAYEVCGGLLTMPGVPQMLEDTEMQKLANTYGKTWHLWQVDRGDPVPLGEPKLMAAITKPTDVNQDLLKLRDQRMGINSQQLSEHRMQKFVVEPVSPDADQFNVKWK